MAGTACAKVLRCNASMAYLLTCNMVARVKAGKLTRDQARQLLEHCFKVWVLSKWNGKSLKG